MAVLLLGNGVFMLLSHKYWTMSNWPHFPVSSNVFSSLVSENVSLGVPKLSKIYFPHDKLFKKIHKDRNQQTFYIKEPDSKYVRHHRPHVSLLYIFFNHLKWWKLFFTHEPCKNKGACIWLTSHNLLTYVGGSLDGLFVKTDMWFQGLHDCVCINVAIGTSLYC